LFTKKIKGGYKMAKYSELKSIAKGTEVTIKAKGLVVTGYVISADNWEFEPEKENWYIELMDTKGIYRYWKQEFDGGELLEVK
jgi:hypothetical protein